MLNPAELANCREDLLRVGRIGQIADVTQCHLGVGMDLASQLSPLMSEHVIL